MNWIAIGLRESHADQKRFRDEAIVKLKQEHLRLLELTRNMHRLFEKQPAAEKRRLLDFVVSNSVWKDGRIIPSWRQPFDMIAVANESERPVNPDDKPESGLNRNWLPGMGSYRTVLSNPSWEARQLLDTVFDVIHEARRIPIMYFVPQSFHEKMTEQLVPVSPRAAATEPSKLGLLPSTRLTVEEAILGLVTKSANDAAAALGELLGGSEDRFAQMMTLRARALGMTHTTFTNASGLPDPDQWSTAHDLAILARHLVMDFSGFFSFSARAASPSSAASWWQAG